MRKTCAVGLLFLLLLSNSLAAQKTYTFEEACRLAGNTTGPCAPSQQRQGETCLAIFGNAFHGEAAPKSCIGAVVSPVFDSEVFVEMIGLRDIGKINDLKLTIYRSVHPINNAYASFLDGKRLIILDQEWVRAGGAEAYLVLGHEVGHHFCGHLVADPQRSDHEIELEADRFSGAAIKRLEVYHRKGFLDEALRAATRRYPEIGSPSHPPRAARVEAIKLGYAAGSRCGNLAAPVPGFSPGPR